MSQPWQAPEVDDMLIYRFGHRRTVVEVTEADLAFTSTNARGIISTWRATLDAWASHCNRIVNLGGSYVRIPPDDDQEEA